MRNRLASERSPYLLQHASNPVEWWPWGAEAIAEARRLDRPLFVSIGYATCHWCHVMARESFEDDGVARQLAERFVSVKVDREERPEVDEYCMTACQIFTQLVEGRPSGGWPLSIWLEPKSLEPFFVGTYFPREPAHGRPSFAQVVGSLGEAWRSRRAEVEEQASRLGRLLRVQLEPPGEPVTLPASIAAEAAGRLLAIQDLEWGGYGGAPKFPQASALELVREASRGGPGATGDGDRRRAMLESLRRTLVAMAAGGMHDQVGGGFHRYAVDREWIVPHFEKMLYDQGQLAALYARASLGMDDPRLLRVAARTCAAAIRTLRSAEGGFHCAIDAEAAGREGVGYVWTRESFERAFVDAAAVERHADAVRVFGVDAPANFRDPHHPDAPPAWVLVDRATWPESAIAARAPRGAAGAKAPSDAELRRMREILLAARELEPRPAVDDKVVPGWNGLMIEGLAETAWTLREWRRERPDAPLDEALEREQRAEAAAFLDAARGAADFVLGSMRATDGSLHRAWRDGRAGVPASLEDYGLMARGLAVLGGAETDDARRRHWIDASTSLLDAVEARFADGRGGWFDAPADGLLPLRARSLDDGAMPSGSTAVIGARLRLAELLDALAEPESARAHRARAASALRAASAALALNPLGSMGLLAELVGLRRADPALV